MRSLAVLILFLSLSSLRGISYVRGTPASDSRPPVWPPESKMTVTRRPPDSTDLAWTAALDDSGIVNYRVYGPGVDNTNIRSIPLLSVYGLPVNTTHTFQVYAGDPAGNWSPGPEVTFSSSPTLCICLVTVSQYIGTPSLGGSLIVNNSFTSFLRSTARVDAVTVFGDFGSYTVSEGLPAVIGFGGYYFATLRVVVPLFSSLGPRTLLVEVSWELSDGNGGWVRQHDQTTRGSVVVLPPLAESLRGLAGYAQVGLFAYAFIVSLAVVAVIRRDRKKRAALLRKAT